MFPSSIPIWGNRPSIYVQKKVLTLAPDALVYLNGRSDVPICLKCNTTSELKDDITNISVSLGVYSVPGSASFQIVAPTKTFEMKYIKNNKLIISEMMEIKIFFKARFPDTNNNYPYYTAFWGITTSVTELFSAGEYTIDVEAADILKWWSLMKVNIHPSIITQKFSGQAASATGSRFANLNPFQTIVALGEISAENMMVPESFLKTEGKQDGISIWKKNNEYLIDYWRARFSQIGKSIKIFGYIGRDDQDKGKINIAESFRQNRKELELDGRPKEIPKIKMDMKYQNDFLPFFEFKDLGIEESEYMSKLDMALEVKNYINYEFFMDVNGHIIFKPPFYNLDMRQNSPYSVIEDSDIISYNFTNSEAEVITKLDVRGYLSPQHKIGTQFCYGYYQDYNLARKYGLRQQSITVRRLRSNRTCTLYAINEMAKINAKRFSGTVNIMGRPELRLGFPVYIPSKDCFYYVTSISHSFTFGSTFTTTLGLEARRTKKIDHAASQRQDGVITNGAMVFVKGENAPEDVVIFKDSTAQEKVTESNTLTEPQQNLGIYLLKDEDGTTTVTLTKTESKIPASDKYGYEVIGGFPYGRNLGIDNQGKLISSIDAKNRAAEIVVMNPNKSQQKGEDGTKSSLESGKEPEAQVYVVNKGQLLSEIKPKQVTQKSACNCLEPQEKAKLAVLTKEQKDQFTIEQKAKQEKEIKTEEERTSGKIMENQAIANEAKRDQIPSPANTQSASPSAQQRLMKQRQTIVNNRRKGQSKE